MSYNVNFPLGTDFILQSFFQLRANFQEINRAFSVNHASMAIDASTAGQHTALVLRPQDPDPTKLPTTSADEIAIFQKVIAGVPQLFFAPNNSQTPVQLTYDAVGFTGLGGGSFQYSTFLPGPFVLYAGFINNPTQGQTITLTPGSTLIYVDLTIGFLSKLTGLLPAVATPTNILVTSFDITFPTGLPSTTFGVYYMAIGKP